MMYNEKYNFEILFTFDICIYNGLTRLNIEKTSQIKNP